MRRIVLEDPFARSAIWSRNLAVFALVVAIFGVLLSRKGLDPQAAVAIVGGALSLAALSVLFAFVAMAVIWHTGFRGISFALSGLALSLVLFAYPAYVAVQARSAAAVTDVSTDLDNPPPFLSTSAALAVRHGITPARVIAKQDRDRQQKLYPDLQTMAFDADIADVDAAVRKIIKRRKWQIVDEIKPSAFVIGHIDVVVKSAVMGFPADVTIRLRPVNGGTEVDIRSVSRAGWQEQPGSNAARVQDLAGDISSAISES